MTALDETILSLGKKRDFEELEKVVNKEDVKTLQKLLAGKLTHPDVEKFLNYVFLALSDSPQSQAKRVKIIEHLLSELERKDLRSATARSVVRCLNCQLHKLSPHYLVRLTQWCVNSIQKAGAEQHILWQEFLPNLLNLTSYFEKVEHAGAEVTGADFKHQVVSTLCMSSWPDEVITPMAGMFVEVQLTPDEHLQVVHKLCEGIKKTLPASLPPLVNQLLLLTRHMHGLIVFLYLQSYFTNNLYNRMNLAAQESSSEEFIVDNVNPAMTQAELLRAESTILFFVKQSASVGHANVRDLLNSLKSASTAPELFLNPFFITVLLTVASVESYQEQVHDLICYTMKRELTEESLKERSFWLQEVSPVALGIESLLNQLIQSCGRERELVRSRLVNLAFAMLDVGTHRAGSSQVWKFGRLVLVRLARKYHDTVKTIVQKICSQLVMAKDIGHYIDTLMKLFVTVPLMMGECKTVLTHLIENTMHLRGPVSEQIFSSLMPVLRNYPVLQDRAMLVLRKCTFSCHLDFRLMAVRSFLLLLKSLDHRSLLLSSQSSYGSVLGLSQSSQVHIENMEEDEDLEPVGLEVLGVLERSITQQQEVRSALYTGLFPTVSKSSTLYPLTLDFLVDHIRKYFDDDEMVLPPLDISKTLRTDDLDVTVQEPLGQLIFVIQQMVTHIKKFPEVENRPSYKTLHKILDSLVERMNKCTPETFKMDEVENMTDDDPKVKVIQNTCLQVIKVYESLMAYTLSLWSLDSKDRHQMVINLYRNYSKFLEVVKTGGKPLKSTENKANKNQVRSKKGKGKGKTKSRPQSTKKLSTVLDMEAAIHMLKVLYSDAITWATDEELKGLRARSEFCRYVSQVTLQLIQQERQRKPSEILQDPTLFRNCIEIGRVLYIRFIDQEPEEREDDLQVVVLALECWNELLYVLNRHFDAQLSQWLVEVVNVDSDKELAEQLNIPIQCFVKYLESSLDGVEDSDNDPAAKKLPYLLVCILSQLTIKLPRHSAAATQMFTWIKKFVAERSVYAAPTVKEMASLLFKMQIRHKVDGNIFDTVALQLLSLVGPIDEDYKPQTVQQYNMVSEFTQAIWLQHLCLSIKEMLDNVDWMVQRMRGELSARSYPSSISVEKRNEVLATHEREVCTHVSHCVKLATILSRTAYPEGPMIENVLKLLSSLFLTLSNVTKYFTTRSSKADNAFVPARFPAVVQLAAGELANHVQWFMLHVISPEDPEEEQKKKVKKGNELARAIKDSKLVPRIVYGLEVFEKNVLHLSKKCAVNLMERVKMLSGRDFRINLDLVKTALARQNQEEANESQQDQQEDETDEINAAVERSHIEEKEQQAEPPKKKKKKNSS